MPKSLAFDEQRFIIAYALGCYLLDFDENLATEYENTLSSDYFITETGKTIAKFAVELLMPRFQVEKLYRRYMAISKLVDTFRVSKKYILQRCHELELK